MFYSGSLVATRVALTSPDDVARFSAVTDGAPLDPAALAASGADEHWLLSDGAGEMARCSLWTRATPAYEGELVGLIGHYAATDALAEPLLRYACDQLRAAGCTRAIGPMDGSTYNRYRLVTEPGEEPPFFLEPTNPPGWPTHFVAAGFAPLAHYYSAVQEDITTSDPRVPEIERQMRADGVRVRPLDMSDFEGELRRVYPVVVASFAQSLLASPISEDAFVAQYRPLEPLLAPELAQIAEDEGDSRVVGFLLVLPDWLQAQRGALINTAIVKTIAVLPEYSQRGLGILLGERAQVAGRALGYTRAIHALMHEGAVSRRLSASYHGRVIRRYTLYTKALEAAS
jgi:GNAT superfamily N-acetyltransferase